MPDSVEQRLRLRTRILAISVAYGVLLVAVAFVVTWRARESQRELARVVNVELEAANELERVLRDHNAFRDGWRERDGATELVSFAPRYVAVTQQFETGVLRDPRLALERVIAGVTEFERRVDAAAAAAARGDLDDPARIVEDANRLSGVMRGAIGDLRNDAEARLRLLDSRADGLMATAVGVTWMIAIVTLALARLALVKIVRPIEALSAVASEIASAPSDKTRRAPVSGDREIALLATDFNAMIDAIAERDAELQRISVTDELTGMPNFRAFQERLQVEIRRADRYGETFGLLVFDLDRFKKYNDEWGHLAGNEALAAVAKVIQANVRDSDFAARYGGEEFVAVVAQTDGGGLWRLAERIRAAVEAIPPIANRTPLTCSIGGALCPDDGVTPESLFEIADQRLYAAKEAGRNRVVVPAATDTAGTQNMERRT